jgi:signal transduction histidine kinase
MSRAVITLIFFIVALLLYLARAEKFDVAHWGAQKFTSLSQYEDRLEAIESEISGLPRASDLDARGTHGFHSNFTPTADSNWISLSWPKGQWVESIALVPTRINTQSGTFANYGFPRSLKIEGIDMSGRKNVIAQIANTRLDLRKGDPLFMEIDRQQLRSIRIMPTDLPELMDKKDVRGFSLAECFVFDQGVNHAPSAMLQASFSIDGEPGWNIRYLTDLQSPLGPPEFAQVGRSLGWHSDLQVLERDTAWIEIDLGKVCEFDSIRVFGARGDAPLKGPGFGFPQRMIFEVRNHAEELPRLLWEPSHELIDNPGYNILPISLPPTKARYVRLTVEMPDKPDDLSIARVLLSEWEIRYRGNNIALGKTVTSNDGYESIPHDSTRIWSRKGINDGYTSSGKIISDLAWISGLSRRFDLRVERQSLIEKIAEIRHRSQQVVNSFLITILSLIILSLALALRRTLRQSALRMKQLRMSISSDLHDEVGSNLATISLLADLPQQGNSSALKDVQRLARESSLSLREIVDLTLGDRPRRPLVERMKDIAKLMLCDHEWTLDADVSPELNPLQRRDLIFFFKEALHNIIQHAHANHVTIRLYQDQELIKLVVADDGCGFEFAPEKSLLTLHQRAASLGAVLLVESIKQKGTSLQLTFHVNTKSI